MLALLFHSFETPFHSSNSSVHISYPYIIDIDISHWWDDTDRVTKYFTKL
jgi:hypothetical protein